MNIMTNIKENKLDQIKQDLDDIELNAKSLDLERQNNNLSEEVNSMQKNTFVLTEVLEKGQKSNNSISNKEMVLKLKDIKSIMEIQNKILTDLINKLS